MKHLLIMAAGTGGHIFPGLAIGQTMQERGWRVSWLGTTHGMERDLVPQYGIEMEAIAFGGLRGKGFLHAFKGIYRLLAGFFACNAILARRKPDVVLGMGGYVTVPGGWMARLRGIPVVLLNADAAWLLSNRILMPVARRVLFGFWADCGAAAGKAVVTGNPVRHDIAHLPPPEVRYATRSGSLRILVVGGSLGAQALNAVLPQALALIPVAQRPCVVHQSGKKHGDALRVAYAQKQVEAHVLDFIDDMSRHYAEADLVICRAGAMTVSELTAAGVASVLVPFLASTTTHQRDNAQWMAQQEASIHIPQTDLNAQMLADLLQGMTRERCLAMACAAYANGRRDANQTIAAALEEWVKPA